MSSCCLSGMKRRRIFRQLETQHSEMSSSMRTSPTTMTFSEALQPHEILLNLNQQRSDEASCDVILRSSSPVTSSVYAHRCILVASSDYFKAFFRHCLTDARIIEMVMPGSSHDTIESVVTFMYTGVIAISDTTVGEIVQLADYLGLTKILELCKKYIKDNLNESNCLKFKVLSESYPLGILSNSVQNYILPRMSALVRRSDIVDLSVDHLRQLLSDKETNYVREADVLKLIQDVIASRSEVDQVEKEKAIDLLDCIEFEYLPSQVIGRHVLSNAETSDWLRERPELLERVKAIIERNKRPGCDVVEAILCQGGTSRAEDGLQVMIYLVKDDVWKVLRQPQDKRVWGLDQRIESMVVHDGFLYALSSRILDLTHHTHMADDTKRFNRLNLQTGAWFVLPSPSLVTGQATLVSAGPDCLLAMDGRGRVERYLTEKRRWKNYCGRGFGESSNDTNCFLPVPTDDGQLYAFRFGSSIFVRRCLSIYRLTTSLIGSDRGGQSWYRLSQIANVAGLEDVDFWCFSATPQLFSFKDELGHIRVQFDTSLAKWTTFPKSIDRPRFIRDIYGMTECSSRVYFVASTLNNDNALVVFDNARGRFKMTHESPYVLSGPLCHVTLPSSYIESLCRDD